MARPGALIYLCCRSLPMTEKGGALTLGRDTVMASSRSSDDCDDGYPRVLKGGRHLERFAPLGSQVTFGIWSMVRLNIVQGITNNALGRVSSIPTYDRLPKPKKLAIYGVSGFQPDSHRLALSGSRLLSVRPPGGIIFLYKSCGTCRQRKKATGTVLVSGRG